jgi:hypothetical protein
MLPEPPTYGNNLSIMDCGSYSLAISSLDGIFVSESNNLQKLDDLTHQTRQRRALLLIVVNFGKWPCAWSHAVLDDRFVPHRGPFSSLRLQ